MSGLLMAAPCTCTFVAPRRHGEVIVDGAKKRPIYLDFIEDETILDPRCPYHGDHGSMVMLIPVGASEHRTPSWGRSGD